MSGSVVKKCGCSGNGQVSHAAKFQDQKYGNGMRVCNLDSKGVNAECTVCGKAVKV